MTLYIIPPPFLNVRDCYVYPCSYAFFTQNGYAVLRSKVQFDSFLYAVYTDRLNLPLFRTESVRRLKPLLAHAYSIILHANDRFVLVCES
ncbi:hypothetical protein D3C71_1654330 [compost metagenome]